jgi:ComF family protein
MKKRFYQILQAVFVPKCALCFRKRLEESRLCSFCMDHIELYDLNSSKIQLEKLAFSSYSLGPMHFLSRPIIHRLKYKQQSFWASELLKIPRVQKLLEEIKVELELLKNQNENTEFCLVPVPLHSIRLRERGYNQAEKIASVFAEVLGIPMNKELLARSRNNASQTKMNILQRQKNSKELFVVKKSKTQNEKRYTCILIDDVLTTGATLLACSNALEHSGHKVVSALTLLRADLESENDFIIEQNMQKWTMGESWKERL